MSLISLTLLFSTLFAVISARPSVIFPLYIYPTPGAWLPLTNVIAANPGVHFKVIINPNSGPFALGTPAVNMSDYVAAVPNITKYSNAATYGYVDTYYPKHTDDVIVGNIDAWLYGPSQLIPSGGIFFDDVISDMSGALFQMNNVATYAREDNFTDIIFNVGQAPAPDPRAGYGPVSGLYNMANEVLVYENYYKAPSSTAAAAPTNVPAYIVANNNNEPSSKLSAVIYAFPSTTAANSITGGCATSKSTLCTFVNSFTGVVESLYVSSLPAATFGTDSNGNTIYGGDYTKVPPNFANFVAVLAGA